MKLSMKAFGVALLLLALFTSSCSTLQGIDIQKRHYRPGFYLATTKKTNSTSSTPNPQASTRATAIPTTNSSADTSFVIAATEPTSTPTHEEQKGFAAKSNTTVLEKKSAVQQATPTRNTTTINPKPTPTPVKEVWLYIAFVLAVLIISAILPPLLLGFSLAFKLEGSERSWEVPVMLLLFILSLLGTAAVIWLLIIASPLWLPAYIGLVVVSFLGGLYGIGSSLMGG